MFMRSDVCREPAAAGVFHVTDDGEAYLGWGDRMGPLDGEEEGGSGNIGRDIIKQTSWCVELLSFSPVVTV